MTTAQLTALQNALGKLQPSRFHEIRSAYYKAAEGLLALADALENADADIGGQSKLIELHFVACNALGALDDTELGKVL